MNLQTYPDRPSWLAGRGSGTTCPDCRGEGQQEVYDVPPGHPAHHPAWTHPVRCMTCEGTGRVDLEDGDNG